MPLQIRRGTNSQRLAMTEPLASGELLYTTDTGSLYIGNGTTLGGVPLSNLTPSDIKDLSASVFTGGVHSGITYNYNTVTKTIDSIVEPDLSNYAGTIRADGFQGNLLAEDSTLIFNSIDGSINLNGTVQGDIVPDANEAYDIGSSSFKFKDLYLSGTSIYLGSAVITASGSAVNLPAGSTVDGTPIGSGGGVGSGVVEGSNYNINIIGDDSTIVVNAATKSINAAGGIQGNLAGNVLGNIKGNVIANDDTTMVNPLLKTVTATGGFDGNLTGNVTGNVTGDLKGSVFNDDSSLIVDATSARLIGTFVTNTGTLSIKDSRFINSGGTIADPSFVAGTDDGYIKLHPSVGSLEMRGLVNPMSPGDNNALQNYVSRGTFLSPSAVSVGDSLYQQINLAYDGSGFVYSNSVATVVDPRYTVSTGVVPGLFTVAFPDRNAPNDTVFFADSKGVFTTPVAFQTTPLANPAARDAALPTGIVAAGMVVFLTDSTGAGGPAKLQVNTDGTTGGWVDLH